MKNASPGTFLVITRCVSVFACNVGSGHDVTIKNLTEIIAKIVDYKGEIVGDHTKPDGSYKKLLDTTKLAKFGRTYSVELDIGLKLAYAEFLTSERL